MFTFIHTYTPDSWDGLLKNGLFRGGDGLKLMSTPYMPEPAGFNAAAGPGSPLQAVLRELRCPFYIDRLQGGMRLPRIYPFDPALTGYYRDFLGENFWGWQMHEWSSNLRSDILRIKALYEKLGSPSPSPERRAEIWRGVRSGGTPLFLEAFTAEEWSERKEPADRGAFLKDVRELYEARSALTKNALIPADSYHMAPKTEIKNGARLLLPEMGWQIPNARIQTAYTRGMARDAGIRWGVYYECWCYNKAAQALTIPFSLRAGQDEWFEDQLTKGTGADRTPEEREQGGTSRDLQARLWRYAYLSGATVMGEEYGVSTTFRDLRDFELSPYGQTKKEFLRFTERFADPGEPFTPFAIVLPKDMEILHVDLPEEYLGYPCEDVSGGVDAQLWEKIRRTLKRIFGVPGKYGNDGHVLTPGGLPDVFDILHEDQTEALSRYEYIIDLTAGDRFRENRRAVDPDDADRILDGLLPLRIDGAHTLYNRTASGWLIWAANNDGVECDGFRGDVKLPGADVAAQIRYGSGAGKCVLLDGTGRLHRENGKDVLALGAGEWVLLGVPFRADD